MNLLFNINDHVHVQLTERGWSKWQLWHLMETFGTYFAMGEEPPFNLNIEIIVEENK